MYRRRKPCDCIICKQVTRQREELRRLNARAMRRVWLACIA